LSTVHISRDSRVTYRFAPLAFVRDGRFWRWCQILCLRCWSSLALFTALSAEGLDADGNAVESVPSAVLLLWFRTLHTSGKYRKFQIRTQADEPLKGRQSSQEATKSSLILVAFLDMSRRREFIFRNYFNHPSLVVTDSSHSLPPASPDCTDGWALFSRHLSAVAHSSLQTQLFLRKDSELAHSTTAVHGLQYLCFQLGGWLPDKLLAYASTCRYAKREPKGGGTCGRGTSRDPFAAILRHFGR
jgi:hypothetical protein